MKTAEKYLLGAGFIVLPFIFSASGAEQMREPKAHFFVLLIGAFLALRLGRRISPILGCVAFLPYLWGYKSTAFPSESLLVLTAAFFSCLLIAETTENDVERGLEILEIAGLVCAGYAMLWQLPGRDHFLTTIPGNDFRRVSVFFGQHTLYGPFCAAAAAPALFRGRFLRALMIALPVFLIDASFTWFSAGIVLASWIAFRFGKPALIALGVAGLLGSAVLIPKILSQDHVKVEALNDNGRFPLWRITWRIARIHPFLGHGFGSFQQQFPIFQSKEMRKQSGIDDEKLSPEAHALIREAEELRERSGFFLSAHNEILESFYEFGILGPLAAFLLLFAFTRAFWRGEKSPERWTLFAIVAAFTANSLGNFPFHLIPQALIPLWAFVAMTRAPQGGILRA